MFFEIWLLHGVVELVGVRCRTFDGKSVNLVWLDYHGISWWLVSIVDGETVNLHRAFLVHFARHGEWYYNRDRGLWEASDFGIYTIISSNVLFYYYFWKIVYWITNLARILNWWNWFSKWVFDFLLGVSSSILKITFQACGTVGILMTV